MRINITQWERRLAPVLSFAVLYFLIDLVFVPMFRTVRGLPEGIEILQESLRMHHGMILGAACAFYGFVRFRKPHPLFDPAYQNWLQTTPWTKGMPLPLGEVRLGWGDAILLAAAALLAKYTTNLNPVMPLILFGISYVIVAIFVFWSTGVTLWVILAFGVISTLRVWDHPYITLAAVSTCYILVLAGLGASFAHVSWAHLAAPLQSANRDKITSRQRDDLGWPFQLIGPKRRKPPVPIHEVIVGSLLAGWLAYCICYRLIALNRANDTDGWLIMVSVAGTITAIFRLGRYLLNYAPPISILGRFATGNIIIPSYDKIFLAPLAIGAISLVAGLIKTPNTAIYVGLFVAAIFAVAIGAPPTMESWQLTGGHRIYGLASSSRESKA